jgi:uncharacterized membrane protein YphA (DoxX/SURF4 family)
MGFVAEGTTMKRRGLAILRLAAGVLFLYAGTVKMLDPFQFLLDIRSFQMTPYWMAVAVAHYLPFLEILCGTALIIRRAYAGALAVLLASVTVFLVAIVSAWARGIDVSCGCFGPSSGPASYPWLLARDSVVLICLAVLALDAMKDYKRSSHAS